MKQESSFALLDALASGADAGLTDLAAAAQLPEATTHGLLDQLVARGVVWHKGGRYRIASRMSCFGQAWRPAAALRTAAHQPVRELAAATQQASVVVILPTAAETVVVAGFDGEVREVLPLRAGLVFPPGNGLDILLAAEGSGPVAPPAGHTRQEWSRLVTYARELGVAFQHSDLGGTLCCVTAPIRARSGQIVASVGAGVFDICRLGSMAPVVRRAANTISANLAKAGPHSREGPLSASTATSCRS